MKNIPKPAYTIEFKELAVKRVSEGQKVGAAARELGLREQTLRNWIMNRPGFRGGLLV